MTERDSDTPGDPGSEANAKTGSAPCPPILNLSEVPASEIDSIYHMTHKQVCHRCVMEIRVCVCVYIYIHIYI